MSGVAATVGGVPEIVTDDSAAGVVVVSRPSGIFPPAEGTTWLSGILATVGAVSGTLATVGGPSEIVGETGGTPARVGEVSETVG
ncbi:hypothetical protein [Amycolatopsis sp.]|uniref:hypothetical protein n=1 Tax=Amycolatopsis sp. TaxID=37632 RepID=UPI002E046680|nr:hypothetical protein [Amycolatopsis sp.]